ncbi:hypothetical protein D3C81_1572020 [compost metagenome]
MRRIHHNAKTSRGGISALHCFLVKINFQGPAQAARFKINGGLAYGQEVNIGIHEDLQIRLWHLRQSQFHARQHGAVQIIEMHSQLTIHLLVTGS